MAAPLWASTTEKLTPFLGPLAENMSSTAENSTTNTGNIIPQLQEQQGQQEQQEQTTQERVVLPSTQGGTSKSKVRGKRKSWVWDHFDKIECKDNSDQRATCKYCEKSLACPTSSGTSCLSDHLNRCKKYPTNVEKSQRTLTFKPLASVSSSIVQASEQAQTEKNDAKPKAVTDYIREILKKQKAIF
ncbi:hypothetical protein Cni_G06596 [Canna indica]|uniref:BED-type domain-containing protein n=1 Tax=Canna indica TaxID=4628 RepID=A0AAQ3JYT9_9LILI|nr:hypothetical protein Cni_G06596 [Canna indica]